MKQYPPVPGVADAPADFFETGHLWIQELIAGERVRFQLQPSGALRVGSRRRTFEPGDEPPRYRHAVQSLRETFDADALRDAVDAVDSVVFFGVATQYDGVPYDWDRLPSVLGIDVWDGTREAFLAVDATERAFERVGVEPVNAVRKEVHVRDYHVESASAPESAWYDGPAAGVVLRKKTGERVAVPNSDAQRGVERERDPLAEDATTAAAETATRERFDAVARTVTDRGLPASFDTVYDRLLAAIYREHHDWLLDDDGEGARFDMGEFRNAVAERTSRFLGAD